jgi:hypothetical protein
MRTALFLSLVVLASTGCATIINGSTQKVSITSDPSQAAVTIGEVKGTTPMEAELARKTPHVVQITKEGYRPESVKLEQAVSGAVYGNIAAGGLIGWGVDAATGAQYKLVPDTVHVVLQPNPPALPTAATPIPPPVAPIVVPAAGIGTGRSLEERLRELDDLKAAGKINDEEYAALRRKVIETHR